MFKLNCTVLFICHYCTRGGSDCIVGIFIPYYLASCSRQYISYYNQDLLLVKCFWLPNNSCTMNEIFCRVKVGLMKVLTALLSSIENLHICLMNLCKNLLSLRPVCGQNLDIYIILDILVILVVLVILVIMFHCLII